MPSKELSGNERNLSNEMKIRRRELTGLLLSERIKLHRN